MREACCGDVSVDMAMISNNSSSVGVPDGSSGGAPAGNDGSVCDATLVIFCPVLGFFLGDIETRKYRWKWLNDG
jgi:hypothetical protein